MGNSKSKNEESAKVMRDILCLRNEPVAVKLIREGDGFPEGEFTEPEGQMSHCQAVMAARKGECLKMTAEKQSCMVGASTLGMAAIPEKVATGEHHGKQRVHVSDAAAAKMIAERSDMPYRTVGEIVCPLSKADFEPDAVVVVDMPERIYWISAANVSDGGRAHYSTAPFQCVCEDATALPILTGKANISLGCIGCRRRTDIAFDEMVVGFPYSMMPKVLESLERFSQGAIARGRKE
ncbi:MAG: DUF169 domain-containing protein [Thermoplasmatales archaeon]|nr:DUF169 domain-containing protein [Thermoplasmatales archaeon]